MPRRILQGIVVSNGAAKTVVVKVEKRVKHPVYKKYIVKSCKYAAHDPLNAYAVGDNVKIIETRPISKTKHWHVFDEAYEASQKETSLKCSRGVKQ